MSALIQCENCGCHAPASWTETRGEEWLHADLTYRRQRRDLHGRPEMNYWTGIDFCSWACLSEFAANKGTSRSVIEAVREAGQAAPGREADRPAPAVPAQAEPST